MPAPKGNNFAKGNKGGGRPGSYKEQYAEMAYQIALLGATDENLAEIFGVTEQTINNWKKDHEDFFLALKRGKDMADVKVVESLYKKATGYTQEEVKIFQYEGSPLIVPYTAIIAPDTTAAIFWLKNRQPKAWRDKQEIEHTGKIINVNQPE